jgi:hypothetical protein
MSKVRRDSGWPLYAGLGPLGALPTVPRLARTFCAMALRGWGQGDLIDDCEVIASELTGNVVRTATGPDGLPRYGDQGLLPLLWVRLLSNRTQVRVETWDNLPLECGVPVQRRATATDECGRGLEMVDRLSNEWGWDHLPAHAAKCVWAILPNEKGTAIHE